MGPWLVLVCPCFRERGSAKSYIVSDQNERGIQGPDQGPLVGSRGTALAGIQGAEPPEDPGVLGFLRLQNVTLLTQFFYFSDKFCCKISSPI